MPSAEPPDLDALRPETIAVVAGRPHRVGEPVNTPIIPASTFRSGDPTAPDREYARGDSTDAWEAFEHAIGVLEGGTSVAFSSGMAAVAAVLDPLPGGARILVPDDCYQGVGALVADGERTRGWTIERLPSTDTAAWLDALRGADLAWLESPSNPLLDIADVPAICSAAREIGVPVAVDNTFATPLLQRPLEHGATYSVQSATKFIGGHSDLLGGVVTGADDDVIDIVRRHRTHRGATPGALEVFLALRGLRTLPLRLERAQETAMTLATRLAEHRQVTRVRYPGLESHPGHELARRTLAGPGAVLSFEVKGSATSTDVRIGKLRVITPATSLGGVESLIERRAKLAGQEHLPPTLLRLSVGCEHVDDLWNDLDRSLSGGL